MPTVTHLPETDTRTRARAAMAARPSSGPATALLETPTAPSALLQRTVGNRLLAGSAQRSTGREGVPAGGPRSVATGIDAIVRRAEQPAHGEAVVQRALMSGNKLLRRTDPHDVAIQGIATLLNQYNATKGLFTRLTPQLANTRFGLLRQIDRAIYAWFSTVSQNNAKLEDNPHTAFMQRLLNETDAEHVELVNKTKDKNNVTPYDTTGMTGGEQTNAQQLWQSIVGGQGKIQMVGNRSHNKKSLSDMAKIMSSATGRNLLSYLNTPTGAEVGGGIDPLTNVYLGQNVNQLPGTVTGALPGPLQDSGVSQSQPLIDNQAYMQGGVPVPVGGAPGTYRNVGNRDDFRQAVHTGQRGGVYNGQQYAFGQGTGAFVRVLDHGGDNAVPGIAGVDNEIIMPRYVTLAHELGHSANQKAGAGSAGSMGFEALFALAGIPLEEAKNRWDDPEEMLNILNVENAVRTETGLDERTSHKSPDGLKKSLRWLHIKNAVINQFGLDNHTDSMAVGTGRSRGVFFTDSGWAFAKRLAEVRNDLHQTAPWNQIQVLLNAFVGMNAAQEKADYMDNLYDEAMDMVNQKGGRDALTARQQGEYDGVRTMYTTTLGATLSSHTEYNRWIQKIYSLQGMLGKRLDFPGMGQPLLRWS